MAGTQVDEIDATLLALKGISDRPVWSEQLRGSTVAYQSQGARQLWTDTSSFALHSPYTNAASCSCQRLGLR
jgi:hypothetical protein